MVLRKSASKPQLNALNLLSKRRSSQNYTNSNRNSTNLSSSLSSSSSSSLTKWTKADNPLVGLSLRSKRSIFHFDKEKEKKLEKQKSLNFSFSLSRKKSEKNRRRTRTSSKSSESNDDTINSGSEADRESECFQSFSELDLLDDSHLVYTKNGREVRVKFGHDYLSVDGHLILYEHIIYWGHTKRALRVSYVENMSTVEQNRVDISLYPRAIDKISPADLANVLQTKVAALYKEITGCSELEAIDVSTKRAQKSEVAEVLNHVDQTSERQFTQRFTQDI